MFTWDSKVIFFHTMKNKWYQKYFLTFYIDSTAWGLDYQIVDYSTL